MLLISTHYLLGTGGYLPYCVDWYPSFYDFDNLTFFGSLLDFFTTDYKDGFPRQNEITFCCL